ncbi:MAG: MerR family transcriptional regulator [Rubrivivax sp.]
MSAAPRPPDPLLSIAAVERDTGLSKDTLRVWERRYGFPEPGRDAIGERAYPLEQVERLRVIKRLLDAGHRPGRVVRLPRAELEHLAESTVGQPATTGDMAAVGAPVLRGLLERLTAGDLAALRHELALQQSRLGARNFVTQVVAPFNGAVGDAWMRGRLQIFHEHLYSELMQSLLRQMLGAIPMPTAPQATRVLLTSLPGEPHALGLLMAEVLFALEGCLCLPMGPQTPVLDIARAADAMHADIVALGFAGCLGAKQVLASLTELRAKLPARTQLWVGGVVSGLQRRSIEGVQRLDSVGDIGAHLRQRHAMA